MQLSTPYALPFRVRYQQELASGERDITIRVTLSDAASADSAEALDATVLPFMQLATSGALAGESIPPWTSTVKAWGKPFVHNSTVEWSLTGVTCDLKSWVMLAQMLLVDHKEHALEGIEIVESRRSHHMTDVIAGTSRVDPYPKRWAGIGFPINFYKDLAKNFTVYAAFAHRLSSGEKEGINEELSAWAPGLMLGAYGVAPVPPDQCTGFPDEEIVFVDNQLEWPIRNFRAHTGAIEGLINVLSSISQKVVQVTEFGVE